MLSGISPVVVGVDGSPASLRALALGFEEALVARAGEEGDDQPA